MRAGIALAIAALCLSACGSSGRQREATGLRVTTLPVHSKLLGRTVDALLVTPRTGRRVRPLLVFLHGHSATPDDTLTDAFLAGLRKLGARAPVVLLPNGGDHSYWHNRADGPWASYVLREAIPAALARSGAERSRVAIGGITMGGFGALDLARIAPWRFCAVGGHSAAVFFSLDDALEGAFDDLADFRRHDVLALARGHSRYRAPVWLDVGTRDSFRAANAVLARELRAGGARRIFRVWPGDHTAAYWNAHFAEYLRFYANACR
jgi:S-formylglutathione hydrolase FrmB